MKPHVRLNALKHFAVGLRRSTSMSSTTTTEASTEAKSTISGEDVKENLRIVREKLMKAYEGAPSDRRRYQIGPPRLVAVSKTKPIELIVACYEEGQRFFGENYMQEMKEKAGSDVIRSQCPDIRWHYIGTAQSNNLNKLLDTPRLDLIETINSEKQAKMIQNFVVRKRKRQQTEAEPPTEGQGDVGQQLQSVPKPTPIRIMLQVNTSGEEQKSGLSPSDAINLATKIIKSMSDEISFVGFMTIGSIAHSQKSPPGVGDKSAGENPDFLRLIETRREFAEQNGLREDSVELSMGMSGDFEEAIRMGSSNVRIGSTIFGARNYPNKK